MYGYVHEGDGEVDGDGRHHRPLPRRRRRLARRREQRVENVLEVEAVEVSVMVVVEVEVAAAARLAKGGAELVKDLEHVEDDVELDHRLDPHVVVPLAHVEAEEQRRLGDDEQPAQDVAALVGRELAAARDAGEGGDDPQRQEGVQRDEGVEARAEAEEEQRLQIPRHLQEVVHAAPPPVVLQIVVGRAVVGLPAELLADEAAERERRRRRRGRRRRRRRRRSALALDPARRRHRRPLRRRRRGRRFRRRLRTRRVEPELVTGTAPRAARRRAAARVRVADRARRDRRVCRRRQDRRGRRAAPQLARLRRFGGSFGRRRSGRRGRGDGDDVHGFVDEALHVCVCARWRGGGGRVKSADCDLA